MHGSVPWKGHAHVDTPICIARCAYAYDDTIICPQSMLKMVIFLKISES
jgi:hypothetical protein